MIVDVCSVIVDDIQSHGFIFSFNNVNDLTVFVYDHKTCNSKHREGVSFTSILGWS